MLLVENDCALLGDAHRQPVGKPVELTRAEPGNILKAPQFTGAGDATRGHLANLSDTLAQKVIVSLRCGGYSTRFVIYVTISLSRRAIHSSNSSAGMVATVVSRKNGTQPSLSASTPPDDATIVRPTAASEDRSAY